VPELFAFGDLLLFFVNLVINKLRMGFVTLPGIMLILILMISKVVMRDWGFLQIGVAISQVLLKIRVCHFFG
jgi:hypothetical protein